MAKMLARIQIPVIVAEFEWVRSELPFLQEFKGSGDANMPNKCNGWMVRGMSDTGLDVGVMCVVEHPSSENLSLSAMTLDQYIQQRPGEWDMVSRSTGWLFLVNDIVVGGRMTDSAECIERVRATLRTLCVDDDMMDEDDDVDAMTDGTDTQMARKYLTKGE